MIEEWKEHSGNIEVEPEHVIARSKGIQPLKDLCKFNIEKQEKEMGKFELDDLEIKITNESLHNWEGYNKIKIGTGEYDKKQIYKVLEEIFNKKILLKDESRAIKREQGNNYIILIQKPINGNYPLIIMSKKWNYIIAPIFEED